ncbi:Glutamate--tRNA ligase [Frankliniella fusca]|uniref:Glutamate--tRNA ligase n=1 Tax=Frankliniella fusca TaxID=407009 RepID=A0AAE1I050_9NEOP|nr:Glutamate--tRNA ligase [Frankliniella fusca]
MAENGTTLVDVPDVVNNALLDVASKQGFKAPRNRDGYMSTLYRCVIRDEVRQVLDMGRGGDHFGNLHHKN